MSFTPTEFINSLTCPGLFVRFIRPFGMHNDIAFPCQLFFVQEEDEILQKLVGKHGGKGWTSIATYLKGRTGKQCRERWHNHLKEGIKKVLVSLFS